MAVRGSNINEKFRSTLPILIQLKEIVEEKSSILKITIIENRKHNPINNEFI
tara:strand:+ start:278 stop:433 length:156 start_codon:yes stop_codon:yes gene_type:complete